MITQKLAQELFIIRDDKLHWRDTGVVAGYLTTACAVGRKINSYPWVAITNPTGDYLSVHRIMILHEYGELPLKRAPDYMEVAHLNGICTDNNRWNLTLLDVKTHRAMDAERIQREKDQGLYHKKKHKSAKLDPSDKRVRGLGVLDPDRVRRLYIMRGGKLCRMSDGREAGYLRNRLDFSVPFDYTERMKQYPHESFDGGLVAVHRLTWLYLYGEVPDKRKRPHYVINHKNEQKWDSNIWNLERITSAENTRKSTAHRDNACSDKAQKKKIETRRRNKSGSFHNDALRKRAQKKSQESQRCNGTGFYDPEMRKKNNEMLRLQKRGFYDPLNRLKAQVASKSPESIKKAQDTRRRQRWDRMHAEFELARAPGNKEKVYEVAYKYRQQWRNRTGMRLDKETVYERRYGHKAKLKYKAKRRSQRWEKMRVEFEVARATGKRAEVDKVASKYQKMWRTKVGIKMNEKAREEAHKRAHAPEYEMKKRDTWRRKRWVQFRADFAAARATGNIKEVSKVAAKHKAKAYQRKKVLAQYHAKKKGIAYKPVANKWNAFRVKRWRIMRELFAAARATGNIEEIYKVAQKYQVSYRARIRQKKHRDAKKA